MDVDGLLVLLMLGVGVLGVINVGCVRSGCMSGQIWQSSSLLISSRAVIEALHGKMKIKINPRNVITKSI